jgi:hypothetical protein
MAQFVASSMGGTCIGSYLSLRDPKDYPTTPEELVSLLTPHIGSSRIPVIVTGSKEEAFRKVLSETEFLSYDGKDGAQVHYADPVNFIAIRLAKYKVHLDAIERGSKEPLKVGDTALFGVVIIDNYFTDGTNLNAKKELVGVRIEKIIENRVHEFSGFNKGDPHVYRDAYGWDFSYFKKVIY